MSWITSRLAGPIAAGLSIVLALALGYMLITKNATIHELRGQVASVTRERDNAKADLLQCRENRITLEEAARRQNAAVDAYKAEGDRRVVAAEAAATKAKSDGATALARANAILARKGETCADADTLIMESIR